MNLLKHKLGFINVTLMLPALFFFTANFLIEGFKLKSLNDLLDLWMSSNFFAWLLSPLVILGGPAIVFLLSAWRVLHISAEKVHEEFIIALSIKRLFGPLTCAAIASGLILLILACAFVENFQIVAR